MASLFPGHRPSIGISFHSSAIRQVAVRRLPFRVPRIRWARERLLPSGVLVASADVPHITKAECVLGELKTLMRDMRDRTVAICLPDEVATMRVLSFEALPGPQPEKEALIRWRLGQETTISLDRCRMVYRTYPKGPLKYVLAVLFNEVTLAQYEEIWEGAELLPMSVSCESLRLFDLVQQTMAPGDEYFFVHRASTAVTVIAIRERIPVFLRRKILKPTEANVFQDVLGTLQYFKDRSPRTDRSSVVPLYWVDTTVPGTCEGGPRGQPLQSYPESLQASDVKVIPVRWPLTAAQAGQPPLYAHFFCAAACAGVA